jgi:hypothetical protein
MQAYIVWVMFRQLKTASAGARHQLADVMGLFQRGQGSQKIVVAAGTFLA